MFPVCFLFVCFFLSFFLFPPFLEKNGNYIFVPENINRGTVWKHANEKHFILVSGKEVFQLAPILVSIWNNGVHCRGIQVQKITYFNIIIHITFICNLKNRFVVDFFVVVAIIPEHPCVFSSPQLSFVGRSLKYNLDLWN